MAASNLAQTRKFHPRLSMMSQYQSEEAKQWELDEIEGNLYSAGCMWDELKETTYPSGPSPCAFSVVGLSRCLPFLVYLCFFIFFKGRRLGELKWRLGARLGWRRRARFNVFPTLLLSSSTNVTASPVCQRLASGRALPCPPAPTDLPSREI